MPRAVDAFAQWTALQPQNLEARRNYTLVLSQTEQYAQAAASAESLKALAQQQNATQDQLKGYQALVDFFTAKSKGG